MGNILSNLIVSILSLFLGNGNHGGLLNDAMAGLKVDQSQHQAVVAQREADLAALRAEEAQAAKMVTMEKATSLASPRIRMPIAPSTPTTTACADLGL